MNVAFPYDIDGRGRSASATDSAHVRQMIEQVLFTAPGERANRPDFGTGLMQLVFAGNSPELASATEFMIQGALQRWLGDVIKVESVKVTAVDSTLDVLVQYVVTRTGERQLAQFAR